MNRFIITLTFEDNETSVWDVRANTFAIAARYAVTNAKITGGFKLTGKEVGVKS